jgi:hypothetical protein
MFTAPQESGDVYSGSLYYGQEGAREVCGQYDVRSASHASGGHWDDVCTYRSATTTTQTQLAGHARSVLSKISPESDASAIASKNARALAVEVPRPILYQNYHVGECKDLIFGVSLVDYATARGLSDGEVPKILRLSIKEIDQRGLTSEGIYRVCSSSKAARAPCLNQSIGVRPLCGCSRGE